MADNLKFLEREILNKVLNAGEDALNVDLTAGGSAMLVDDAAFTPGTSTVQMVGAEFDDTGPDSVDEGDAGAIRMSANRNLYTTIRDAAGNERGVNVDGSNQLQVVEASASAIAASLAVLDDWDDSNYANVNANIAGTDIVGGAGAVASGVQRVTLASDDPAVVSLGNLDNAVDGNYLNVNANIAGTDMIGGAGAVASGVQRITLASDDPAVVSLGNLDNAVDGNYLNINANIAGTDFVGGAGAVASGVQRVTLASDDPGVAKLGEIETTNNANQVLLGTIDSDTNDTKNALNKMLYGTGLDITALDGGGGDQALGATYESLYVGVGGNVVVTLATSASDFTFVNVASGQMLHIQITHVKQSGTTATNMIAMKA